MASIQMKGEETTRRSPPELQVVCGNRAMHLTA